MNKRSVKIKTHDDILSFLKGRVFHVTPTVNMQSIRTTGAIIPNASLEQESFFGNTNNGFFRLRGCVSFFDYREFGSKEWRDNVYKCFPTRALNNEKSITILFLSNELYPNLLSWSSWKDEKAWSERVIPYIEVGYEGVVPLTNIVDELIVELDIVNM